MHTLLLFTVLFTVLLQPVAASDSMEFTLPGSPLDMPFTDLDDLILCPLCGIDFWPYPCMHFMPQVPTYDTATFIPDSDIADVPFSDPYDMGIDPSVLVQSPVAVNVSIPSSQNTCVPEIPVHHPDTIETQHSNPLETRSMQAVIDYVTKENIEALESNETTVQFDTVGEHVKDTYNAGDRQVWVPPEVQAPGDVGCVCHGTPSVVHHFPCGGRPQRRQYQSARRQNRRRGGFTCNSDGCDEPPFDRQCDLNRHKRAAHLPPPHKCSTCNKRFLYPKDLRRHMVQHSGPLSTTNIFRCDHPGCGHPDGFSRRDNLLRHKRKQHSA